MHKKYIVRQTEAERKTLEQVVKKLKGTSQKMRRAHILLKSDVDGSAWTDAKIAEAFDPDGARAYLHRLDFCYTPKHGSWLNVAECELSCLPSQCLRDRRLGELEDLQTEIATWSQKTNAKQRGVDWQFKINDARRKLKRLYHKIKT